MLVNFKIILLFFFLLLNALPSDSSTLSIEGEQIYWDQLQNKIEITNSVKLNYKDFQAFSEKIVVDLDKKNLNAEQDFKLSWGSADILGENLNFDLTNEKGEAKNIEYHLGNVNLHGEEILINPDRIELNSSSFTTCNLRFPHYHFSAKKIYVYPQSGLIILKNGLGYIGNYPVFPIPTYLFGGSRFAGKTMTKYVPIPEVGYNPVDEWYVEQPFPYSFSDKAFGTTDIEYFSSKGFRAGFLHNYVFNRRSFGHVKFNYPAYSDLGKDIKEWESNISYTYILQETPLENAADPMGELIANFGMERSIEDQSITLELSRNERINYEEISKLFYLSFFYPKINTSFPLTRIDLTASTGIFFEEGKEISKRNNYILSTNSLLKVKNLAEFSLNVNYDYTEYDFGFWKKGNIKFEIFKELGIVKMTAGYLRYILNEGEAYFDFEKYRFNSNNQLIANFSLNFAKLKVGVESIYDLIDIKFQELDYKANITFHCWETEFIWRSVRNEASFGLKLIF